MEGELVVNEEVMSEFSKIKTILDYLKLAYTAANNSLLMVQEGTLYQGKAQEDMLLFYQLSFKHIQSLMLLYSNAYEFAGNAIIEMILTDNKIARALETTTE